VIEGNLLLSGDLVASAQNGVPVRLFFTGLVEEQVVFLRCGHVAAVIFHLLGR